MDDKGANDKAVDTAGSEPQVSAADVEALRTENQSLKNTQRTLQRDIERLRRQGVDTRNLESRFQANEELMTFMAESIGKLAKAAELEGVDPAPIIAKLKSQKATVDEPPAAAQKAGTTIVALAAGAGIGSDEFDDKWQSDERFAQARIYWSMGQYDAAVEATRQSVVGARKPKTYTEEELKEAVKAAATTQRRDAASSAPGTSAATANERTITAAEFAKLPIEQRLEMAKDLRKALQK